MDDYPMEVEHLVTRWENEHQVKALKVAQVRGNGVPPLTRRSSMELWRPTLALRWTLELHACGGKFVFKICSSGEIGLRWISKSDSIPIFRLYGRELVKPPGSEDWAIIPT